MTTPTVSIIVPTYNSAAHLRRMIASVCEQSYADWELILVDGSSRDGTLDIAREYQSKLGARLVIERQVNQGCCFARNTGLNLARGEYVAFLDSDDAFRPQKLARQLDLFRVRPELGLVFCDYEYVGVRERTMRSAFDEHVPFVRSVPTVDVGPGLRVCSPNLFEYLVQQYFIATITALVRRSALKDLRFVTDNWTGLCEWLFFLEIVKKSRAGYVNEPLCTNYYNPHSLTRQSAAQNSLAHRKLLRTMIRRLGSVSPTAHAALHGQLAAACRQIGLDAYKRRDYVASVRSFGEALGARPSYATIRYLAKAIARAVATLGRQGAPPPLPQPAAEAGDF